MLSCCSAAALQLALCHPCATAVPPAPCAQPCIGRLLQRSVLLATAHLSWVIWSLLVHCSQFLIPQNICSRLLAICQPHLCVLADLLHQRSCKFQLCWCEKHVISLQVLALCEKKREPQLEYIIVDTPGQIEIFTWSASGAIITEAFAAGALDVKDPFCLHYFLGAGC